MSNEVSAPRDIRRTAPAKINLALHVLGPRDDGFHEIESLVVFAGPGDGIIVTPSNKDRFELTGPFAGQLADESENLALRARDALRKRFPAHDCPPIAIFLEKNLPVASGIGGGSSDAAAALLALATAWRLPANGSLLTDTGLEIGADVPMCLHGRPLLAFGRGEKLRELEFFPALEMILVNPVKPVSTANVFRTLTSKSNTPLPALPEKFSYRSLLDWLEETRNDLEDPAIAITPEIGDVLAEMRWTGVDFVRMSGSGATCFGICRTRSAADKAAQAIAEAQPGWFVWRATSGGVGLEEAGHG